MAAAPAMARGEGKDLDGVVNLNTAGTDLLELLPGIGPAKVRSIFGYRQRHPFRTVDELVRIQGIGRKMVRRLRAHLAVNGPSTARAVRRPREPDPLPPTPPPAPAPARKGMPARPGPAPAAPGLAAKRPQVPPVPPGSRGRPPPPTRERHAPANHCARPP